MATLLTKHYTQIHIELPLGEVAHQLFSKTTPIFFRHSSHLGVVIVLMQFVFHSRRKKIHYRMHIVTGLIWKGQAE